MDNWDDLQPELERYRSSASSIRRYLETCEVKCRDLIKNISICPSFEGAQESFDTLHDLQRRLSVVKYKFEFPIDGSLADLIYHLDRDDIYSRKYWYAKFRGGVSWPT